MAGDKAAKRAAKAAKRAARAAAAQDQALADIPITWLEQTGVVTFRWGFRCPDGHGYVWREGPGGDWPEPKPEPIPCETCGKPSELGAISTNHEMIEPATGRVWESDRDLPAGAVFEAIAFRFDGEAKYHNWRKAPDKKGRHYIVHRPGPDGRVLCCMLPDRHPWVIDSRANNCTLPNDDEHWCWNRSGRPEDGTLDVRKGKPGQTTCSAGGGSIATGGYHGFLHDGRLRRC